MLKQVNKLLVALMLLPGVGRQRIKKIFSVTGLVEVPDPQLLATVLDSANFLSICQFLKSEGQLFNRVEQISLALQRCEIGMLNCEDASFPFLLLQIPDCPLYIFYRGDCAVLSYTQLAIVGSRNASSASLRHAYDFARSLSLAGVVVTSGLAQGVDGAAHSGALNGSGLSVAVMGTGLDRVYPYRNIRLAEQILARGCWVSEYLPGTPPVAANFPRRNRIISGLSLGVLVIEARAASGTLITARMAIEQNREVFAIPGPIDYQGSIGCHRLIAEGATLVQSVDDILQQLGVQPQIAALAAVESFVLEPALAALLELIDYSPTPLSLIAQRTAISQSDLLSMLVELELQGYVENSNCGICRIK